MNSLSMPTKGLQIRNSIVTYMVRKEQEMYETLCSYIQVQTDGHESMMDVCRECWKIQVRYYCKCSCQSGIVLHISIFHIPDLKTIVVL